MDHRLPLGLYGRLYKMFTPAPDHKKAGQAVEAFRILGPIAAPAIHDLFGVARSGGATSLYAIDALAGIGQPAFPAVLNLTTIGGLESFSAILTLDKFGTNAVPVLRSFLSEPSDASVAAAITLGRLRLEPDTVIPALVGAARRTTTGREAAVSALVEYGPQGQQALRMLLNGADTDLARTINRLLSIPRHALTNGRPE